MAEQHDNSKSERRASKSIVPWSSSLPPTAENRGYQQFDKDTMEAREYQQELENRRQDGQHGLPSKKPEITVHVGEMHPEHFERAAYPQYPPLTKPSGLAMFLREWWMESVACILVIGALLAIVGVVWYHNERPLPNWKHGITINALISIFLVIMKSGMGLVLAQGLAHLKWTWFDDARPLEDLETYDKAAHGPLGAAMLLYTVRNRHIITSVGAVVTIAALAVDPTVQAMVKYYDCAWPVAGVNATMPKAQVYSDFGIHIGAGLNSVPLGLQSSVSSGLFTPGQMLTSFNCTTGNCTLPSSYSSIGFCSACEDISDRIKTHNLVGREYFSDGSIDPVTGLNYTEYNYTTTTLPSGLTTTNAGLYPDTTYFTTQADSATGIIQILAGQAPSYIFASADGCGTPETKKTWPCKGYGAASCTVSPCVRTFEGNVSAGRLVEQPISRVITWGQTKTGTSPYVAMVDMTCVTTAQKAGLARLGYKFDNTTHFMPYLQSFDESTGDWEYDEIIGDTPTYSDLSTVSLVPRKCIYEYNQQLVNSLNYFWAQYFNGTLAGDGTYYSGPSQLEALYNGGTATFESVAAMFHNVSLEMTTHVRQTGVKAYSPPTLGVVMHNVTCVRVRWQFLIFPALIIVLMLTFFVGMALHTRNRQGVQGIDHGFKSSPLALMVHGLDSDVQEKLNTPVVSRGRGEKATAGAAKNDAKKVIVRLTPTEHGLRFVKE